jgi:hypothetical protein
VKIISATLCASPSSVIIEYDSGVSVCAPCYDGNQDYENYKAWLAEGNTPNPYVPPPPAIPQQVPMWAVRTVLQNDGLFDQAQALIEASTDNALKNVWEYGNFAERNSRAISVLAIELGLTEAQVDQMFIDANNLTV